jgi:error-prone DNA polymerase
MEAICRKMLDGMQRNGIPPDVALRIFNQINAFADYGFPESHAASFALLVYASAYLKHYYAPEYTAAILNAQPMGFYSVGTLIEDARRHGVEILPVDATISGVRVSIAVRCARWRKAARSTVSCRMNRMRGGGARRSGGCSKPSAAMRGRSRRAGTRSRCRRRWRR